MPRFGGIGIPLIAANTTDGLGLGLGGEFFRRPDDGSDGFVWKLQGSAYVTTSLQYQAYELALETRAGRWQWLAKLNHRVWGSMLYAGSGGSDVLLLNGEEEGGNRMIAPYVLVSVSRPFEGVEGLAVYAQSWSRLVRVDAGEGSILEDRVPLGAEGGVYSDLTFGAEIERMDRWPLPSQGFRGEVDVRGGLGAYVGEEGSRALFGAHLDVAGYTPLVGEWLVLGGRLLAARTTPKPFFEQDFTGGRRRDELGYQQPFLGYGRTRSRGDGAMAAMIELRPKLVESRHRFFDVELHLSFIAEEGFLPSTDGLGPHMPTLGFGPVILWQGGTVLRPFAAWGWRAEAPGAERFPSMQFGVALTDPL